MPRLHVAFWTTLAAVLAVALGVATYRYSSAAAAQRPLPVPPGDQEVAWFHTATSTATWERFVAGVHYAARQQPRLRVDDARAFPDQSTAIPEVVVSLDGSGQRLLVRWYKQSGQMRVEDWVRALARRDPPPLAVIGGGSSDRALELAQVLAGQADWPGRPPLLLITTATAEKVQVEEPAFQEFDLMHVYSGRSFRFCFTNRQMARAIVDFVWRRPELRPRGSPAPSLAAVGAAATNVWGALGPLAWQEQFPGEVFSLQWRDDPYSVDLANQFKSVLFDEFDEGDATWERPWLGEVVPRAKYDIASSVGGYLRPNPQEAIAVKRLVDGGPFGLLPVPRQPLQRSLLILPTVPQPARRVLAGLAGAAPDVGRHLVAVSGDAISFNHVYRDGALIWNVRLVPVPLVFFTHQNPLAWDDPAEPASAGRFGLYPPNGTDDVLHFADVMRILAEAAYDLRTPRAAGAELLADSDELASRLRRIEPAYFDADGNRRGGSGEYVIYLRPGANGNPALPSARLEVWTHRPTDGWQRVREPLEVKYSGQWAVGSGIGFHCPLPTAQPYFLWHADEVIFIALMRPPASLSPSGSR